MVLGDIGKLLTKLEDAKKDAKDLIQALSTFSDNIHVFKELSAEMREMNRNIPQLLEQMRKMDSQFQEITKLAKALTEEE